MQFQSPAPKNIEHLQNLFSQRSPKTKYITQGHIEEFTDSITKEIINGDTVINNNHNDNFNKLKSSRYEEDMKKQRLHQAKRQKQQLQRKLAYVNRSIDSIKNYSYVKAENQFQLSRSRKQSPQEIKALKEKDKQLTKEIRKHRQKIQKIRQQQQQRKRQSIQHQAEEIKKHKQQEKQMRKKQILQNMKKIKQKIQQRQVQMKRSTQRVKQILHKKQLYNKMQDRYKQLQSQTLQQRKKKLSQIRNLHKPFDIEEIKQHQKKVLQIKKQKDDIRQRQRKINQSAIKYKVPYMGSYYKQIIEKKNQNQDPLSSSKLKIDKIKQFTQHIRQNFIPQVSEKKRKQIEQSIRKQAELKKIREEKLQQTVEMTKQKGSQYMDYLRKIPKRRGEQKIQQQGSKTARPVYKNYLSHSTDNNAHKTQKTWSKILTKKQLNKKDKAKLLQYQSQKMEQILRRKQQQGRLLKKDNQQDIDNQYYNMIKAKLNLLTSD